MKRLLIIFALFFAGTFTPAFAADRPLRASDGRNLRYLPSQWSFIVNFDAKGFWEWAHTGLKDQPQEAMLDGYRQQMKALVGIDWEKLSDVTVFVGSDLEKEPGVLAVIRGEFDSKAVARHFAATLGDGAQETKTKSGMAMVKDTLAYVFPADGLLLIGEPKLVIHAANSLEDAALPAGLKNVLDHTPGNSIAWAAARPRTILDTPTLADWRRENPDLAAQLASIESASLFLDAQDDGILIHILGDAGTAGQATQLSDFLNQRRTALMTKEGANIFGFFALHIAKVDPEENRVAIKFALTADALEKLWHARVILKPNPEAR